MVECQLPKLVVWVRFPLPAPNKEKGHKSPLFFAMNMTLFLTTNNIHNPNIEIKFIDKKTNKNSEKYEIAVHQAQQTISILKIILEDNRIKENKVNKKLQIHKN